MVVVKAETKVEKGWTSAVTRVASMVHKRADVTVDPLAGLMAASTDFDWVGWRVGWRVALMDRKEEKSGERMAWLMGKRWAALTEKLTVGLKAEK